MNVNDMNSENSEQGAAGAAAQQTDLAAQLEQAQTQAAEYLDNWRRAAAELSNARKRMEKERSDITATAAARVLEKLLPIMDDIERAFKAVPGDEAAQEWLSGFRMIQRKLQTLLESEGVTELPAEGAQFDPNIHYAVSHEEQPGFSEGDVIEELARGYKLGERVLRPSMVRVAKGG